VPFVAARPSYLSTEEQRRTHHQRPGEHDQRPPNAPPATVRFGGGRFENGQQGKRAVAG
jgi:hypothetical protein